MKPGLFEFQRAFSTEQRCHKILFEQRWPDGFRCPKCQAQLYSYISTRKLYQCKNCSHQVSITAGTIFHKTRKLLVLWFIMIYRLLKVKRRNRSVICNGFCKLAVIRRPGQWPIRFTKRCQSGTPISARRSP